MKEFLLNLNTVSLQKLYCIMSKRLESNHERGVGMELKGHGHGLFISISQHSHGSNEENYEKA
jgi:hypothetical protein